MATWPSGYYNDSGTSSTSTCWTRWATDYDTSTSTTADSYIWTTWSTQLDNTYIQPIIINTFEPKPKVIEQKAEIKAQQLLLDLIGEDELKVYNETGRLFVKGRNHDYIIQRDRLINGLQQIQKDKIVDFCVHIQNKFNCPKTDNVIALKLAIENDESEVLKLANRHDSHIIDTPLIRATCMQ